MSFFLLFFFKLIYFIVFIVDFMLSFLVGFINNCCIVDNLLFLVMLHVNYRLCMMRMVMLWCHLNSSMVLWSLWNNIMMHILWSWPRIMLLSKGLKLVLDFLHVMQSMSLWQKSICHESNQEQGNNKTASLSSELFL